MGAAVIVLLLVGSFILVETTPFPFSVPKDLVLDTDVDIDDVLALFYLLKQNCSLINLKAITINANAWVNPAFGVNMVYDVLYMMGRDDIPVGVGGEGGIALNGTIFPDVGGYQPIIDQGMSTAGSCRYRQAIPKGSSLDIDTNYGLRRKFLPQARRQYVSGRQPTSQQVMLDALSTGSNTVLLVGSHTSFATFLMTYPHLKMNIEHVYAMGGGKKSGNLFTAVESNPKAEFNMFTDPFAAYQVLHSGIPMTLVPLEATDTVPVTSAFVSNLQKLKSLEGKYAYETLNVVMHIWPVNFSRYFFMWDTFTAAVAISGMLSGHSPTRNALANIYNASITVVTSNKPYGVRDGSNPLFDTGKWQKFELERGGVHSGHVQTGLRDPFCYIPDGFGICMDGRTIETKRGKEVHLVKSAKKASSSVLFYSAFLQAMDSLHQTARFNLRTQFPYFRELEVRPNKSVPANGKALLLDIDMSPGDILTLIYLLKVPRNIIDLKGITVAANGWANAAAVDIVYDVLHMMGRDDIPVGLGAFFSLGEDLGHGVGDCKYRRAIPNGASGLLDSDTLYGLARLLPRSPRGYATLPKPQTADQVITGIFASLGNSSKLFALTGGPLTNVAQFLLRRPYLKHLLQEVYILGGSSHDNVHSSKAGSNMFLDPEAAEVVLRSGLNITFVPPDVSRRITSRGLLKQLKRKQQWHHHRRQTPESRLAFRLLQTVRELRKGKKAGYQHAMNPLREVVAAAVLVNPSSLPVSLHEKAYAVPGGAANGHHRVRYVDWIDTEVFELLVASALLSTKQSAAVPSFSFQMKQWSKPRHS